MVKRKYTGWICPDAWSFDKFVPCDYGKHEYFAENAPRSSSIMLEYAHQSWSDRLIIAGWFKLTLDSRTYDYLLVYRDSYKHIPHEVQIILQDLIRKAEDKNDFHEAQLLHELLKTEMSFVQ